MKEITILIENHSGSPGRTLSESSLISCSSVDRDNESPLCPDSATSSDGNFDAMGEEGEYRLNTLKQQLEVAMKKLRVQNGQLDRMQKELKELRDTNDEMTMEYDELLDDMDKMLDVKEKLCDEAKEMTKDAVPLVKQNAILKRQRGALLQLLKMNDSTSKTEECSRD